MPSSTSNSDARIPDIRWGRMWGVTLGIFVAIIGTYEVSLRWAGFPLEEHPIIWSIARDRAAHGAPVFLGSSRIQSGLDPDVWIEEMGGDVPGQLGTNSGPALPVLESLAEDPGVRGIVLVDAMPFHTFDVSENSGPQLPGMFSEYARFRDSPAQRAEVYLRAGFMRNMAWRSNAAAPKVMRDKVRLGIPLLEPPRPHLMRADRYRPIDFSARADTEPWTFAEGFPDTARIVEVVQTWGQPADSSQIEDIVRRLDRAARAIEARGGRVVFLALPACGIRKTEEDRLYPRERYWDRLAEVTSSLTIHSDDHESLRGFACYDGSHLDQRDAVLYTRALTDILRERWASGSSER